MYIFLQVAQLTLKLHPTRDKIALILAMKMKLFSCTGFKERGSEIIFCIVNTRRFSANGFICEGALALSHYSLRDACSYNLDVTPTRHTGTPPHAVVTERAKPKPARHTNFPAEENWSFRMSV